MHRRDCLGRGSGTRSILCVQVLDLSAFRICGAGEGGLMSTAAFGRCYCDLYLFVLLLGVLNLGEKLVLLGVCSW